MVEQSGNGAERKVRERREKIKKRKRIAFAGAAILAGTLAGVGAGEFLHNKKATRLHKDLRQAEIDFIKAGEKADNSSQSRFLHEEYDKRMKMYMELEQKILGAESLLQRPGRSGRMPPSSEQIRQMKADTKRLGNEAFKIGQEIGRIRDSAAWKEKQKLKKAVKSFESYSGKRKFYHIGGGLLGGAITAGSIAAFNRLRKRNQRRRI